MTSLNKIALFAIAVLIAFAWAGWEAFTYEMTPGQKRAWFLALSGFVILSLAWIFHKYAPMIWGVFT